jgi:hypothetical protein
LDFVIKNRKGEKINAVYDIVIGPTANLNTYLISMVVSLIARGEKITGQEAILSFYNTKLAQTIDSEQKSTFK